MIIKFEAIVMSHEMGYQEWNFNTLFTYRKKRAKYIHWNEFTIDAKISQTLCDLFSFIIYSNVIRCFAYFLLFFSILSIVLSSVVVITLSSFFFATLSLGPKIVPSLVHRSVYRFCFKYWYELEGRCIPVKSKMLLCFPIQFKNLYVCLTTHNKTLMYC